MKELSHLAHNQEDVGASPTPATNVGLLKWLRELSTKQSGRLCRCKGSNPLANAKYGELLKWLTNHTFNVVFVGSIPTLATKLRCGGIGRHTGLWNQSFLVRA